MRLLAILLIIFTTAACTQLTRLSRDTINGTKNYIFVRPFSSQDSPDEITKLVSDHFFTKLEAADYFSGKDGKNYQFDFYMGQECPTAYDCYYITGEVSGYRYQTGCCGNDGVEVTASIRFWNDLTKKPLFDVSEWNNEIFETDSLQSIEAMERLAEDTAGQLVTTLLNELADN